MNGFKVLYYCTLLSLLDDTHLRSFCILFLDHIDFMLKIRERNTKRTNFCTLVYNYVMIVVMKLNQIHIIQ